MNLNFFLREMTHLRYYAPVIREGNARGAKSTFYVVPSGKYNCPFTHQKKLETFCKQNLVSVGSINEILNCQGYLFTSEESGIDIIKRNEKAKKISMTYQTDFIKSYKNYFNHVDNILMPSRNIADFYGLHDSKNLYVGIPKYDIELDETLICEKYKLNKDEKKVLFVWPKTRDLHKFPIDIINNFNELGWRVLIKARAKDPVSQGTKKSMEEKGNHIFYDDWYPHTSQELLEVSNLVVNCGSTTIEECVMHEVPLINFDIKPSIRHGQKQPYRVTHSYLYDYDFCLNLKSLNSSFSTSKLESMIAELLSRDLNSSFKQCKEDWLYDHKNTCKNLLDVI